MTEQKHPVVRHLAGPARMPDRSGTPQLFSVRRTAGRGVHRLTDYL